MMPNTESTPDPGAAGILLTVPTMTDFHTITVELPKKHGGDKIAEYCRKAAERVDFHGAEAGWELRRLLRPAGPTSPSKKS